MPEVVGRGFLGEPTVRHNDTLADMATRRAGWRWPPIPWNRGLLIDQRKPRTEVRLVHSNSYQNRTVKRDLATLNPAIDSKLRACDLGKLRLDDICSGASVQHRARKLLKIAMQLITVFSCFWVMTASIVPSIKKLRVSDVSP